MRPKYHVLYGFIVFLMLFFVFRTSLINALVFFVSTVFVDLDHYLFYVFKKKKFSLKSAVSWYVHKEKKFKKLPADLRKKTYSCFCFFHGAEWILFSFVFGFFFQIFFYVSFGLAFHLVLDYYSNIFYFKSRFYRFSVIYFALNLKRLNFIDDISLNR